MEKVKLKNGTVLEFKEIQDTSNLSITFENQEFTNLRKLFDNPENLSAIEILTEGDTVCTVYNGYMKTDKYIIQGAVITVELIKPDETQQSIQALQQQIDSLREENSYLQETVDTLVLDSLEG